MENQTTAIAAPAINSAPVKAANICLILAWVFALLPIPFISMTGMIAMNIVAFILAIICMSKSAVKHGVGVLVGSLIGTPIMYFLGLALFGSVLGNAISSGYNKRAAQVAQSKQQAPVKQQAPAKSKEADESVKASEMAGKWKGQFIYSNGVKANFTMTMANPSGNLINGNMTEVDPNTNQSVSSIISGDFTPLINSIIFKQRYSGQSEEATCAGEYIVSTKLLRGTCSVGGQGAAFEAKKETGWL